MSLEKSYETIYSSHSYGEIVVRNCVFLALVRQLVKKEMFEFKRVILCLKNCLVSQPVREVKIMEFTHFVIFPYVCLLSSL